MPRSRRFRLVSAAIAAVALVATAGGALGQSFFQQLFGVSTSRPHPAQRLGVPMHAPTAEEAPVRRGSGVPSWRQREDGENTAEQGGRKYRTVCVRLCDGYYFPISDATPHRSFQRDVNMCEASCGSEARLYYMPAGETNAEEMTDLTGKPYGDLPNAFKYRKSLVSGCACKPMPWSEAARAKHRAYALAERQQQMSAAGAEVAMQSEARAPASRYPLPPAVSGPGVAIISANGIATMDESAVGAASQVRDGADNEQQLTGAEALPEADPAAAAGPVPGVRSRVKPERQKVTIINSSAQAAAGGRARRMHGMHPAKATGVVFGPFSSEPRRINYGN